MRTYHVYLIREDIAKSYFGREVLLFDLFSRFARSHSLSEKKVLYKQMKYITKPLQVFTLQHRIQHALAHHSCYRQENGVHTFRTERREEYGKVTIKPQYIRIETDGSIEIETMFFEILRKNEATFLAMDYDDCQYGWLNPIKQERKYV